MMQAEQASPAIRASRRLGRFECRTALRWAAATVVTAAVIRVGWAAWIAHAEPGAVRDLDTPGYLGPARALVDAGRFSLSPTDATPMFVRTPGYPTFLAAILWLTDSEWAISPIQAVASLFVVAAVVLVGRRLMGVTAGLLAGLIVALDPLQFAASGTLMTESLTSVGLAAMATVGAVVFAVRRPSDVPPIATFALGVLVALVTMVRPTFWFYPALIVALLVSRCRHVPRRTIVVHVLVFLLPVAVIVGGWQLRNHNTVGSWQLSGIASVNLYCYNAAEVEARVSGTPVDDVLERFGCPRAADPDGGCTRIVGLDCWVPDADARGQGFDEWGRKGLEILLDHPVQTARVLGEGIVREVAGPGTDTVAHYLGINPSPLLTAVLFAWNALLWGFAALGALVAVRSHHRAFWAFVVATIAYVVVISAGTNAYSRFRTPVIPLLALLAALGVRYAVRRVGSGAPVAPVPRDQPSVTGGAG
jgi:4-amino-4-deoxy-L-arabinose transferase-like glycosyltransferase